jgi:predicted Rossmann fold nucleotide-binding protein DprA/Smf involved in DNA uptake
MYQKPEDSTQIPEIATANKTKQTFPAQVAAKVKAPEPPNVSTQEKDVLSVLAPEGSFVDEIAMACRISVSEALASLTMLELKGLVRQFSGKRFAPR